jgi:hypothetical protein
MAGQPEEIDLAVGSSHGAPGTGLPAVLHSILQTNKCQVKQRSLVCRPPCSVCPGLTTAWRFAGPRPDGAGAAQGLLCRSGANGPQVRRQVAVRWAGPLPQALCEWPHPRPAAAPPTPYTQQLTVPPLARRCLMGLLLTGSTSTGMPPVCSAPRQPPACRPRRWCAWCRPLCRWGSAGRSRRDNSSSHSPAVTAVPSTGHHCRNCSSSV